MWLKEKSLERDDWYLGVNYHDFRGHYHTHAVLIYMTSFNLDDRLVTEKTHREHSHLLEK